MAIRPSIDVAEFLGKQLETASPDLLCEVVRTFAEGVDGRRRQWRGLAPIPFS